MAKSNGQSSPGSPRHMSIDTNAPGVASMARNGRESADVAQDGSCPRPGTCKILATGSGAVLVSVPSKSGLQDHYVAAVNGKAVSCSCPGWRARRYCSHARNLECALDMRAQRRSA